MIAIIEATSTDDALHIATECGRAGVRAIVPLPSGEAWRYSRTKWAKESWPVGVDASDLPCVCLE